MTSNFSCPWKTRTSTLLTAAPPEQQKFARHSRLKMRLGALPLTELKMPSPLAVSTVYRSSQYGKIALLSVVVGRQMLVKTPLALLNCKLPLELTFTLVNGCP